MHLITTLKYERIYSRNRRKIYLFGRCAEFAGTGIEPDRPFSECPAFIISGCQTEGNTITPGYVWLGGKIRYFGGANPAGFPYFIYEANTNESVVYANEINKRGRCCYLCAGGTAVPQVTDPVTGFPPQYLEVSREYAPRLNEKFVGRYALLLDSPASRQKVKRMLLSAEK